MNPSLPLLRDTLLALSAGGPEAVDPDALASFSQADWEWFATRARDYRLLPLVHDAFAKAPEWPVPTGLREACEQSHRRWVFRSLIMQQALIEIGELLDAHGIAYAALKGASLSLEFYAEPALRPMRDLDIMVAPDQAERAYALLMEAGYAKVPSKGDYGLDGNHHLPPLANKDEVWLELHHRIAPRDWSGSLPLGERLLSNARPVDFQGHTIRMAHPTDTLLHLIVHASFQHLFDNGPNLLSDLSVLANCDLINWPALDIFAQEHGLTESVALSGALFQRYADEPLRAGQGEVPKVLVEQAAALMTQDPELHWHRHLLRKRRNPWQRIADGIGRVFKPTDRDLSIVAKKDVKGLSALRYYPSWLFQKTRIYLGAEFMPELQQEAETDARLEAWLGRPESAQHEAGR